MLPRYEGSTHNSRVLNSARNKGFSTLPSYFYLTNTRYSC